jgi:putative oxidoreductase
MKIAVRIARLLLALIFVFFGLNGFLHFLPMPPPPGLAGQYAGALYQSHHIHIVWALQIISGILLLINRYVPLALVILAPIIVNILLFHALMAPSGLPMAFLVLILWLIVAYWVRAAFAGLLVQRTDT